MAQLTGTSDTHRVGTAGGLREDLEDVIWDLFAEDTYCLTNFEKTKAQATYHEWLTDALSGATANRMIEGDDFAYTTIVSPTRVGNYVQTSKKTFLISSILEEVSKAGRKSQIARDAMKQMRELKNDVELALVGNQASSAGGSATARSSAGMESWISGNIVKATTTSSSSTGGFSAGVVTAPVDGTTTGAMTEASFKSALQAAWADGGDARVILCDSTQKSVIDGFAGIATRFVDVQRTAKASIIGSADVYVSAYGRHTLVLHRHVRSQTVMAIDPEYWGVAFIRRPFMETLAKTGDAEKRAILTDFCLVSRNQNASAKVVSAA